MNSIELFPARIKGRVVKAKEIDPRMAAKGIGGAYDPSKDAVIVPGSDTAYARTIRLHESAHAIWSLKSELKANDVIGQAIEDARIHQLLETENSTRRDELFTAISDVREVSDQIRNGVSNRAMQGLALLRSAAILRKANSSKHGTEKLIDAVSKYHSQGIELLDSILASIASGDMENARALTSMLLTGKEAEHESSADGDVMDGDSESEDGESKDGESKEGETKESSKESNGEGKDSKDGKESKDTCDKEESKEEPTESKSDKGMVANCSGTESGIASGYDPSIPKSTLKATEQPLPESIGEITERPIPASIKKAETIHRLEVERTDKEDGTVTVISGDDNTIALREDGYDYDIPYPNMYVHTLSPDANRKVKGQGRNDYKSASQGIKIRTNRLALNSLSPSGSRLFETKHLGGTVLIDASGSMLIDDSQLYSIAQHIPAGKIAYYSGTQDYWRGDSDDVNNPAWLEENWCGHLVVYANAGRIRSDRGCSLPFRKSGNLVDYAAILWLLKQPAPRYLVFDTGFTGTDKLMNRARKLLKDSIDKKRIILVYGLRQLRERFDKK